MKETNYLNKIFTIPYLDSIQHSKHFQSVISDKNISLPTTYKSVITDLYRELQATHRNEYFYKNELLNSLLIQNGKISSCSALTELPVADSKTDMIFVDENDIGTVYEIKTELDTLNRLESQIQDYYKAFPYIYVVTSSSHLQQLEQALEKTNVGIIELTNDNKFAYQKEAAYNASSLSYNALFRILRKKEFESIVLKYFGKLPEVSDFVYYRTCLELLENLDIVLFQKEAMSCLRKRNLIRDVESFTDNTPYELSFYGYFSKKYRNKWDMLGKFLDTEITSSECETSCTLNDLCYTFVDEGSHGLQADEPLL